MNASRLITLNVQTKEKLEIHFCAAVLRFILNSSTSSRLHKNVLQLFLWIQVQIFNVLYSGLYICSLHLLTEQMSQDGTLKVETCSHVI
jgi:hypothetical protein